MNCPKFRISVIIYRFPVVTSVYFIASRKFSVCTWTAGITQPICSVVGFLSLSHRDVHRSMGWCIHASVLWFWWLLVSTHHVCTPHTKPTIFPFNMHKENIHFLYDNEYVLVCLYSRLFAVIADDFSYQNCTMRVCGRWTSKKANNTHEIIEIATTKKQQREPWTQRSDCERTVLMQSNYPLDHRNKSCNWSFIRHPMQFWPMNGY